MRAFPRAIIHDAASGRWLRFERPRTLLQTRRIEEVLPALGEIAAAVAQGQWAAGFLAYESAPAFDPALRVRSPNTLLPLLWFGVFDEPRRIGRNELADGPEAPAPKQWIPTVEEAVYPAAIRRILDEIRKGNTYQVNYTLRLRAPYAGSAQSLFASLIDAQEPAYGMLLETEAWALCSASPELFLEQDGTRLLTRPMKGTRPRGLWPAEDRRLEAELAASEKDRAEHVMIVDMARNDLGRVARIGSVHVERPFTVEAYPTLWQMISDVRCTTQAGLADILKATFPAASITGAPKASTMRLIAELETTPRGPYTGAMGFIAPGPRMQLNVSIRTVVLDKTAGAAEYGTGGGIVWDSRADAELEECQVKARILTRRLPPFSLLETLAWTPEGGIILLEEHLDRLAESARYFGYLIDRAAVRSRLLEAVRALPSQPHRVRMVVDKTGEASLAVTPLQPLPAPYRLRAAPRPIDRRNVFLYHKTTHRDTYEQALLGKGEADDVLLWNDRGEVTETTLANLLVEKEGRWITPPIECGLLGGVHRNDLVRRGLVTEQPVRLADLHPGTRLRLCNSVRGCWESLLLG